MEKISTGLKIGLISSAVAATFLIGIYLPIKKKKASATLANNNKGEAAKKDFIGGGGHGGGGGGHHGGFHQQGGGIPHKTGKWNPNYYGGGYYGGFGVPVIVEDYNCYEFHKRKPPYFSRGMNFIPYRFFC
jgi:hypothetical protein